LRRVAPQKSISTGGTSGSDTPPPPLATSPSRVSTSERAQSAALDEAQRIEQTRLNERAQVCCRGDDDVHVTHAVCCRCLPRYPRDIGRSMNSLKPSVTIAE
jgi:hypothetical protein